MVAASSLMMEAEAIREGLAACVEKGYQKVIVETNAANLVKMLQEEIDVAAAIEGILVDVKQLAKNWSQLSLLMLHNIVTEQRTWSSFVCI